MAMSAAQTAENPTSVLPKTPSAPFDDKEADIVIRTSDNVDFLVYSVLLRISSPFFKSMLSLPQPEPTSETAHEFKDGKPIICVTENSKVIDSMFRFCYPFGDPDLEKISDIVDIVEAMKKYDLVQLERAAKLFCAEQVLEAKPFQVFAIVCKLRMKEEVQKAAFYTLRYPLPSACVEEFALINGLQLQQLLLYRAKCAEIARQCLDDVIWSKSHPWFTCRSCGSTYVPLGSGFGQHVPELLVEQNGRETPRTWFHNFLPKMKPLIDSQPWPTVFTGKLTSADIGRCNSSASNRCDCENHAAVQWDMFVKGRMVEQFAVKLQPVKINITF